MSKITPSGDSNKMIRDAIQKIALHGIIDPNTQAPYSDRQYAGFVVAVHGEDESDEQLKGTVDVCEYKDRNITADDVIHTGVYLTAIQNNKNGLVIIPKIGSDVIVTLNPIEGIEYVSMFSHADIVRIDSHEEVTIGVKERKEFDINDPEGDDIDDLEETGIHAQTKYTKDSVVTEVRGDDDKKKVVQTINTESASTVAGDNNSSQVIDNDKAELTHGKASATVGDNGAVIKMNNTSVTVEDGTVYLGSKNTVDDAVLGGVLADVIMEIMDYLSQAMTSTMMGPQPMTNKVPNFIAMKARIKAYKNSHTGFLTQKVKVQK